MWLTILFKNFQQFSWQETLLWDRCMMESEIYRMSHQQGEI